MNRILRAPSPALVISIVALFVALGGTSYAALNLPANSVGAKQLKTNAVISSKIKNGAVTVTKIDTTGLTVPNATNATNADHAATADSATNADQLGGVGASSYQRTTLPSGQTETGVWAAWGDSPVSGGDFNEAVTFPVPLAGAGFASSNVVFVPSGTSSSAHCPGIGQADAGYLCVYEVLRSNSTFQYVYDPTTTGIGASQLGFAILFNSVTEGDGGSEGEWAVTAP